MKMRFFVMKINIKYMMNITNAEWKPRLSKTIQEWRLVLAGPAGQGCAVTFFFEGPSRAGARTSQRPDWWRRHLGCQVSPRPAGVEANQAFKNKIYRTTDWWRLTGVPAGG